MQSITISASDDFIMKIMDFIAKSGENVKIKNQTKADEIKEQLEADIKAYRVGKLETSPLGDGWKYL